MRVLSIPSHDLRRRAARELPHHITPEMVAAPMAYFPFGGANGSFYGDLKAHGRDGVEFCTDKKVVINRWL